MSEEKIPISASHESEVVLVPRSAPMSLKDGLSLLFSLLAFIISASTFYFTNLRQDDHAWARLAGVRHVGVNNSPHVTYDVAFVNAGNRPAIVTDAQLLGSNDLSSTGGKYLRLSDESAGLFPVYVAAREVKVVSLSFPEAEFVGFFDGGITGSGPAVPATDEQSFFISFEFVSVDSNGAVHEADSGKFSQVSVTHDHITGASPVDGETFGQESGLKLELFR